MVIEEFEHLVVRLPAQGYGTTEFDMSRRAQKPRSFNPGRTRCGIISKTTGTFGADPGGWKMLRLHAADGLLVELQQALGL